MLRQLSSFFLVCSLVPLVATAQAVPKEPGKGDQAQDKAQEVELHTIGPLDPYEHPAKSVAFVPEASAVFLGSLGMLLILCRRRP